MNTKRGDQIFKDNLSWEDKAKQNPLFAVMAVEQFEDKSANPDEWSPEDLQMFFAKGQFMFDVFLSGVLRRSGLVPGKAFVVEYGSGMGRILKAVKAAGYDCAGIDISETMLNYSKMLVPEVQSLYILHENGTCEIPSAAADFVYTYAVMQHIQELSRVKIAVREMCRILKPGGLLKFHFRTLDLPFHKQKIQDVRKVYNFETRSLVFRWGRFPKINRFFLPILTPVTHTNWVGVPLSFRFLERTLNQCNVQLIGIEEDIGPKKSFAWALARKS